MSDVENRIIHLILDNSRFEGPANAAMGTLDKLKKALNFDKSQKDMENLEATSKKMSFAGLAENVDKIQQKFTALGIVGVTALQNITNSAINTGKQLVKAFTIDPVKTGFQEYETQINAVQTILANTSHAGTTINDVNKALDELNHYADMTIYNFTEMTRNIGTFTAAGVDLDTSVAAIKGIANLAAVSGSTSQQASTAMYQLSQALAAGKVNLQDWNSVVNAGMGGKVFQDALMDTARVHGIAIDKMVEQENGFRNTLQKGWLTSEILTETLSKFTGDLTKEQIRAMGYTEEQANAILKMGETANDAATKVKTFTQLMDTLKEAAQSGWAQSWEIIIGDFEEAKELLTEVSDALSEVINTSANARNEMLQTWKDLGGRTALIEGLRNVLKGIVSVIKPIKDAFRDIFPPTTGEQLFNLTKGFEKLSEHFILSDKNAQMLRETFKGFFSIVKVVVDVIGLLVKGVLNLVSHATPLTSIFLSITSAIGRFLSKIGEASIAMPNDLKPIQAIGEILQTVFSNLAGVFDDFAPTFQKIGNILLDVLDVVNKAVDQIISNLSFERIAYAIDAGLLGTIIYSVKNFVDNFTEIVEDAGGLVEGVKDILDGVKESLEAYQQSLKAGSLLKIAQAVGLLTLSLIGLSTIDPEQMAVSLGALTLIFGELTLSLMTFSKYSLTLGTAALAKTAAGMISISTAVLILTGAMKILSTMDWDGVAKGLIGLAGSFTMLAGATYFMSANAVKLKTGAVRIIALATAIGILSLAVKQMGSLDTGSLIKGLAGVGAILAELAIFENFTINSKGLIGTAVAMNLLGTAMLIFSQSIEKMGALPIEQIGKGLLAMAGALGAVTVALNFLPTNTLLTSAGLIVVANALTILSNALTSFGLMQWDEIGKSMLVLSGSLTAMVVAINLATTAMPGALALGVVSTALLILANALNIVSSIPLAGIGAALLAFAGTLAILGVAGVALGPVVPVLLSLAAAVSLFGVGVGAAGAGVLAFATGLTALAAAVTASGLTISAVIVGLINLIPTIIAKVGEGLVKILGIVSQAGKAITDAVSTIIQSVLSAVTTNLPLIVDSGMKIILGILEGIDKHIGQITETAISIVLKFIQAVESKLPDIVNTAFNFIVTFFNTLAQTIEQPAPLLGQAMGNVASAMITGLVKGLANGAASVVKGVWNLGQSAINGLKEVLGIHSPSKEFEALGMYSAEGYALGLQNGSELSTIAMQDSLTEIVGTLSQYYTKFKEQGIWLGDGFFTGLTDGINKIKSITGDLEEPSETVGTESGLALTEGFETAVTNTQGVATSSVNNMMNGAIESLQSFRDLFEMTGFEVADGFWDGFDSSMSKLESFKGVDGLSETFGDSGVEALSSLTTGINDSIPTAVQSTVSLQDQMLASLDGRNPDFQQAGQNLVDAFTKGIRTSTPIAVSAAGLMASKSDDELDRYYNTFYLTGTALVQGFANGITEETWYAEAQARAMANAAYAAAMEELDAHSPSRLFMKVGSFVARGFANGISNGIGIVETATKSMAGKTATIATNTLKALMDAISDDDMSPVITPVLDLSNIQNGIKGMNNTFARAQIAAIGNSKSENTQGENSGETTGNNVYNFTQNNYSPKALSRLDIYRQTKSQFSELRGLTS